MRRKRVLMTLVGVLITLSFVVTDVGMNPRQTRYYDVYDSPEELLNSIGLSQGVETWTKRYEAQGTTVRHPDGRYTYSTTMGEQNIWNGTGYIPYIWNETFRYVDYTGYRIEFYDWYIVIRDLGDLVESVVDDSRWFCEYWDDTPGTWRTLDLYSHSWLEPVIDEYSMTFGQSYTDGFSMMNVSYTISNTYQIKIRIDFFAETEQIYRFTWQSTGMQNEPTFIDAPTYVNDTDYWNETGELLKVYYTVGAFFGDADIEGCQFVWTDVDQTTMDVWSEWTVADKKLEVYFGNVTVGAGETFVVDPSLNPTVGADADDCWWYSYSGSPTIQTGSTMIEWHDYMLSDNLGAVRFALALDSDAYVLRAVIRGYEPSGGDGYDEDGWLERVDEANCGAMETRGNTPPTLDATPQATLLQDGVETEWSDWITITPMVQEQLTETGWTSGWYIGFGFHNPGSSSEHWFDDYGAAGSNQMQMEVDYQEATGNELISMIEYLDVTIAAGFTGAQGDYVYTFDQNRTMLISQVHMVQGTYTDDAAITNIQVIWYDDPSIWCGRGGRLVGTEDAITIRVWAIEFSEASGVNCTRIGASGLSSTGIYAFQDYDGFNNMYLTSLDPDHSFIWISGCRSTQDASNMYTNHVPYASVFNSTHFNITHAAGAYATEGWAGFYFQVIQGACFEVQHGDADGLDALVTTLDIPITEVENINETIITTAIVLDNSLTYMLKTGSRAWLTSTTNLHVQRYSGAGSGAAHVLWQVIWCSAFNVSTYLWEDPFDASGGDDTHVTKTVPEHTIGATVPFTMGSMINGFGCGASTNLDTVGIHLTFGSFVLGMDDSTTVYLDRKDTNAIVYKVNVSLAVLTFDDITHSPVNNGTPACTNLDETDNLFARHKEYTFTSAVSDADGYSDIDYVNLTIIDGATTVWSVMYDEDTNSFSEGVNASYIDLNTGTSTASRSGNDISLTWKVTIEWDHPDERDLDINQYVIDSGGQDDDDNYTSINYDFHTLLTTWWGMSASDGSGTSNRGDFDGMYVAQGGLQYWESTDPTYVRSDVDIVDMYISAPEYGSNPGPYLDDTIDGSMGGFMVTCYADDAAGSDTITLRVVDDGAGIGGADLLHGSITTSYISDIVHVTGYTVADQRVDVDTNVNIDATLTYDYDETAVTTGSWTINGYSASHQGSGVWRITRTSSSVTNITYNNVQGADSTHGITGEDQNGQATWVVWDRIQILTTTTQDGRINYNTQADIRVTAQLEYDGHALGSGDTLYMNGTSMSWAGSYFQLQPQFAQVGLWNFFVNSSSANEATYGITVINLNGNDIDQIWDRIRVLTTTTSDAQNRMDIGTTVEIRVTLWLDYDDTYLGSGDSVTLNDTAMTWDSGNSWWDLGGMSYAAVIGAIFYVNSSVESTYGITALDLNGIQVTAIWDRIYVFGYGSPDNRIDNDETAGAYMYLRYEYNDELVDTGTQKDGAVTFVWSGTYSRWQAAVNGPGYTEDWVLENFITLANDEYGISETNQNGQSYTIIFDTIQVQWYDSADTLNRFNTGTASDCWILLYYDYDNTPVTSGTMLVNGVALSHFGSGIWNFTETKAQGSFTYNNFQSGGGDTYDITTVDQNGQSIIVWWDYLSDITMIANLTNGDSPSMYARLRYYLITTNVTDGDGYDDIDTVMLLLFDNSRVTNYWTVMFDQDTSTFSVVNGSGYIDLSHSTFIESGTWLNITWSIKTDWDHPDIANIDTKQWANDSLGFEDVYWDEADWTLESRLDYSVSFVLSDGSGTTDRGDLNGTITATGTIIYYGSGSVHPLDNETDIWISSTGYNTQNPGPWSSNIDGAGQFSYSVYADDIVGLDTFTCKVVIEGTGSGGTDLYYTTSQTDTYIADIILWELDLSDWRQDLFDSSYYWVTLTYAYDQNYVQASNVYIYENTTQRSMTQIGDQWRYQTWYSIVNCWVVSDVDCTETLHGLTLMDEYIGVMYFDGDGDSLEFASDSDYRIYNSFTISIWFMVTSGDNTFQYILCGYSTNIQFTLCASLFSGDTFALSWNVFDTQYLSYSAHLNTLYHVVMVMDGNDFDAWLNGVRVINDGYVRDITGGATPNIHLGSGWTSSTFEMIGWIGECIIWNNTQLTDTQIKSLYYRDYPSMTNAVFWVDGNSYNVTAGTVENHQSGSYGNDGTMTGNAGVVTRADYESTYQVYDALYIVWTCDGTPIYGGGETYEFGVLSGTTVNFTFTSVIYAWDRTACTTWTIDIRRFTTWPGTVWKDNHPYGTALNDTNDSVRYGYGTSSDGSLATVNDGTWGLAYCGVEGVSWVSAKLWITWSDQLDVISTNVMPDVLFTDGNVTVTSLIDSDVATILNVWLKALTAPAGFSDEYYEMSLIQSNLYYRSFADLDIGYYAFEVIAWDGISNTTFDVYCLAEFVVEQRILEIQNPIYTPTDTENHLSGTVTKICNYYVFENNSYISVSAALASGSFSITWDKNTTIALFRWSIKFNDTVTIRWVNGSYENTEGYLEVQDPVYTLTDTENHLTGLVTLACNYYVFENDTFISVSGSLSASSSFSITWDRNTTYALFRWGVKFNDTTTIRWVNGSYENTEETFTLNVVIEDWMPLTSTIRLSGTTNYGFNFYVYHEGIYNDEYGTISSTTSFTFEVTRDTSAGEHTYQVYFNSTSVGGERWFNFTDLISGSTLNVVVESWMALTSTIRLTGTTNYAFDFYVYREGAYNSEYGSITSTTSFTFELSRDTSIGEHSYQVYFNSTSVGGTRWFNFTDLISASVLVITMEDWTPLSSLIRLIGTCNNPFDYYVYREGVYASETGSISSSTSFSFTIWRNTTYGEHNYQIYFNSTSVSGDRWYNITDSLSTSLVISVEDWSSLTATISLAGTCNAAFNFYVYREGVYNNEYGTGGSDGSSFSFEIARVVDGGEHAYQIYFNSSAVSGARWFNFTDTVSSVYDWLRIKLSDQSGQKINYELDVYVNGTLVYGDPLEFYGRTDSAYEIAVYDKFGDELHNHTYAAPSSRQYNITLLLYSFKVKSWIDGKVLIYIYSSGGGNQSTWLAWGSEYEWHVFSGKSYQVTWATDGTNIGVWGHGTHYFPALDSHALTPDPNWYDPAGAVFIEIDAYGIAHLYDRIPDPSGGGSSTLSNSTIAKITQSFLDEFNPLLIMQGKGRLSLYIIGIFGTLAYGQYFFTKREFKGKGKTPKVEKETKPSKPKVVSTHKQRGNQSSSKGRRTT